MPKIYLDSNLSETNIILDQNLGVMYKKQTKWNERFIYERSSTIENLSSFYKKQK